MAQLNQGIVDHTPFVSPDPPQLAHGAPKPGPNQPDRLPSLKSVAVAAGTDVETGVGKVESATFDDALIVGGGIDEGDAAAAVGVIDRELVIIAAL